MYIPTQKYEQRTTPTGETDRQLANHTHMYARNALQRKWLQMLLADKAQRILILLKQKKE
jgi:hypothetical protein